jgi:DNA-binding beta-propeller fold protein YncE
MKKLVLFVSAILLLGNVNAQDYYVYVTAESEDEVALIKFDGKDAKVIETIPIGTWPAEIEGPHGINVSPDGKYWYLSVAHGNPYGFLYKYSTENNKVVGSTTLGLFPASLQVSKTTGLLYCVNFNLHGDMVPSSVSVVDPENMIELTRIETGVMPHGSRISPDGKFQYSVGMMSGELFEIDAVKLKVSRILDLDADMDGGMDHSMMDHSKMDHGNMQGMEKASMNTMKHSKTKPTWVIPHPIERKAYVAGNGTNDILEIDLDKWEVTGRMAGGKAPYNVDISPDGQKLVVTYKGDASTGIWDLKSGEELARVDNTRKVTHGVTISTDSKFAFVSVEGIGGEPGSVDVIDLSSNKLVSSAEVGKQAGGIIFWKMD